MEKKLRSNLCFDDACNVVFHTRTYAKKSNSRKAVGRGVALRDGGELLWLATLYYYTDCCCILLS